MPGGRSQSIRTYLNCSAVSAGGRWPLNGLKGMEFPLILSRVKDEHRRRRAQSFLRLPLRDSHHLRQSNKRLRSVRDSAIGGIRYSGRGRDWSDGAAMREFRAIRSSSGNTRSLMLSTSTAHLRKLDMIEDTRTRTDRALRRLIRESKACFTRKRFRKISWSKRSMGSFFK